MPISGLRAGITIAATYPAAVIAMAVMRAWKGTLLEENIARTAGSIGEGIAAGAIFTIPAFLIAKAWPSFRPGGRLLEIDGANHGGQHSGSAVHFAGAPGDGGRSRTAISRIRGGSRNPQSRTTRRASCEISVLEYRRRRRRVHAGKVRTVRRRHRIFTSASEVSDTARSAWAAAGSTQHVLAAGGTTVFAAPSVSPAYLGVGYIIGLRLASIQFAGGVLAWGLMVPLMIFFLGPQLRAYIPAGYSRQLGEWPTRSGDISCGPSLSAECWSGAAYTFSRCERA